MEDLVIPSEIPWAEIKGTDLEELLYWLFDSMGAKDLEWRRGGKGSGASDQGRDIQCRFHISSPEGELASQQWWIESKGRKTTVEPADIKERLYHLSAEPEIDVLVIATNTQFSNPTIDWVKKWQSSNKRPIIKLWDQNFLERLLVKHPLAVIRLYSKALSPQGKVEVARARLWNYVSFTDKPILSEIWAKRADIKLTPESLFALIASELANGDITVRAWAADANTSLLVGTLTHALGNFLYLAFRASDAGTRQEPIVKALSYVLMVTIYRTSSRYSTKLIIAAIRLYYGKSLPQEVRKIILSPIARTLVSEIRDVCTSSCERITTDNMILSDEEIKKYWSRLDVRDTEEEPGKEILTLETFNAACKLGLAKGEKAHCPLVALDDEESRLRTTLQVIETVINGIMKQKSGNERPHVRKMP